MSELTLKQIRGMRDSMQRRLSGVIAKELSDLERATGLLVHGVTIEVLTHYSKSGDSARPDFTMLTATKIDLGGI